MTAFDQLEQELGKWESSGLCAQFWMRDDDAIAITPQLNKLASLAEKFDIKIGLAVIPGQLQPDLADLLNTSQSALLPMCHGWQHINYNRGSDATPSEFGSDRPLDILRSEARLALGAYEHHFGSSDVFFVPPFGNLSPALAVELPGLGFAAISNSPHINLMRLARLNARYGSLPPNPMRLLPSVGSKGRMHLNAHIDPIDWRRQTAHSREHIAAQILGELRIRRKHYVSPSEPIGILTHNLVHDQSIWDAADHWLSILSNSPAASFPDLGLLMRQCVLNGTAESIQSNAAAKNLAPTR